MVRPPENGISGEWKYIAPQQQGIYSGDCQSTSGKSERGLYACRGEGEFGGGVYRVSIDRSTITRSLLLALLLMWPLLAFGRPAYMPDSAHYQNGGQTAFQFVAKKLHLATEAPPSTPAAGKTDEGRRGKMVARSLPYSILGYLLGGPSGTMIFLAMFHALCVGVVATALFMALAGPSLRAFSIMAAVLVFGTGAAPFANFIMPDIFCGTMIGALAVLPFYARRFSPAMLGLQLFLIVLAVAVHPSHPPVALAMALAIAAGLVVAQWYRRKRGIVTGAANGQARSIALVAGPVVAGIALTLAAGYIGLGKASIAPQSYPLALARSLDNGPARWYLNEECRKDPHRYAMCEVYGTKMPDDAARFVFGPTGVVALATPQQLDRIRAEERPVLIAAALRYPLEQLHIVFRDVPYQFVYIGLVFLNYNSEMVELPNGKHELRPIPDAPLEWGPPPLIEFLHIVSISVVIVSLFVLAWRWRRLRFEQRGVILALVVGLAANAAVCGIFSGVAQRYQARVIWLVPLVAVAFARDWQRDEKEKTKGSNA